MTEERNWREAKPKWVVDAAKAEMKDMELVAALRWPTEADPVPLPFGFGDYDRPVGDIVPGRYWAAHRDFPEEVHIRQASSWPKWEFSRNGEKWSTSVVRGNLYPTKREAELAILWSHCRAAAKTLYIHWRNINSYGNPGSRGLVE